MTMVRDLILATYQTCRRSDLGINRPTSLTGLNNSHNNMSKAKSTPTELEPIQFQGSADHEKDLSTLRFHCVPHEEETKKPTCLDSQQGLTTQNSMIILESVPCCNCTICTFNDSFSLAMMLVTSERTTTCQFAGHNPSSFRGLIQVNHTQQTVNPHLLTVCSWLA